MIKRLEEFHHRTEDFHQIQEEVLLMKLF